MQMTVPRPREQALEQIMAYILENKLSADDKLPPEREMCQMWGGLIAAPCAAPLPP